MGIRCMNPALPGGRHRAHCVHRGRVLLCAVLPALASCGGRTANAGDSGTSADSSGDAATYTDVMSPLGDGALNHADVWDGNTMDGTVGPVTFDAAAAQVGLAGFAFVVNGVVQNPMPCPSDHWEFPLPQGEGLSPPNRPPIPGVSAVFILNTGTAPLPYTAQSTWNTGESIPGGATGAAYQLVGVLAPGTQVDVTSVYVGGIVAILGSSEPFSNPSAGTFAGDEGEIPWPVGVEGSGGKTTMFVAEIEVPMSPPSSCSVAFMAW
jgi:hypothetical protein